MAGGVTAPKDAHAVAPGPEDVEPDTGGGDSTDGVSRGSHLLTEILKSRGSRRAQGDAGLLAVRMEGEAVSQAGSISRSWKRQELVVPGASGRTSPAHAWISAQWDPCGTFDP